MHFTRHARPLSAAVMAAACLTIGSAWAAPYASNVSITGTNVNFILNEPADALTVSINGGAPMVLDGSTKGLKSFTLASPTDTFSITATKSDAVGYTIPTGATIATSANGFSQPTNGAGFRLISDDANLLNRFNSPRGVDVVKDVNNPNFGTTYIANSAAGTGGTRTLGDGMYAVRADQSDAFGYGDAAQNPGGLFATTSSSSPFRVTSGPDGNVYVADFSDATGNVYRLPGNLGTNINVFAGIGGPSTVPAGQNHGSTTAVYVEGSSANGNLTIYTLDEDLTGNQFGAGTADKNNLWQYNVGSDGNIPYNGTPTRVNASPVLLTAATSDLDRGSDGKWYLAQNRAAGSEPGVTILSPDGSTVLFDSLTASRTILGNPTAVDIVRNVQGMAVSPDQKFMALMLNNSDVAVLPLVDGIPDLTRRVIVDTGTDVNSGRDIAFDAADNIHYVSSGQGLYRVLAPGGVNSATTSWNGQSFSFAFAVPEPTSLSLLALGGIALLGRRRRA